MALDKYEKEDFFNLLEKNDKLQKIIKSIYFSMGHNVDMINTSSLHTFELILEYIHRELIVVNEPKQSIVFSIKNRDELERFFNEVEIYYKKDGNYLFIFNFISLDDSYEAEYIFMMMNKERNRILEGLNAPMLLVMPKTLKSTFAYTASDFWSVNKFTVNIEYVLNTTSDDEARKQNPWERAREFFKAFLSKEVNAKVPLEPVVQDEIDKLIEIINEIEREVKKDKNDLKLQRHYLIELVNLADYFNNHHRLKDAYKYYDKALVTAQNLRHKQPDSIEAKRDLSVSLNKVANIYLQKGQADKALEHYQESLLLRESIEKRRPDSIEAKRDLSVSLNKVANIYLQKGEADKALEHYQESLLLRESIEKRRPDSIEAKRDLSVSYYKLSTVYKFEKKFEKAIEMLLKARSIVLPLQKVNYGDFEHMLKLFESQVEEMRSQSS